MREKEFKAVFDDEKYAMPQDVKYRVKNRISEKAMSRSVKPFFKRSASAVFSVVLASILVITAAAVGGIALFQSIYGENIEPIMPYSEQFNLTETDENYELTLHEAVADEYTTAYIFSVKRLTVGASEAIGSDSATLFKSFGQNDYDLDDLFECYNPQDNPEKFTGYSGYNRLQTQIYYANTDIRVMLIRTGVAYDAENNAKYLMRAIDDLKTEDTDYYALYVVNGEDQALSIGVSPYRNRYIDSNGMPCSVWGNGPEITLPKVTQKAPSVTRSVQEYYRQYLKQTSPATIFSKASLVDVITITPLAVYVKNTENTQYPSNSGHLPQSYINYINSAFYRTAELVFNDGIEKSLNEMAQDEMGIKLTPTTGVYLFDEVVDTSLVKSFMVYDTVEFPMDTALPVIDRETGAEIVPKYEAIDLLYDVGTSLANYLDSMYPEERKEGVTNRGKPIYLSDNSCKFDGYDCEIEMAAYDFSQNETFAAAADRLLQESRVKYHWEVSDFTVKDGTSTLGNVRYADMKVSILGGEIYHTHFFFFETGGKLIVLRLNEKTDRRTYYSLDAILQLITFE